jgi:carbon-monoxide dehydrogenase large subunit
MSPRWRSVNNRLVPNPMEPRAALAHYDEAEEHYTLYTTSQNPHVARLVLSAFLPLRRSTSCG